MKIKKAYLQLLRDTLIKMQSLVSCHTIILTYEYIKIREKTLLPIVFAHGLKNIKIM